MPKISALPAGTTLAAANLLPAVQSGVTNKITGQNVLDYVNASAQLAAAAQVTGLGTLAVQNANNVTTDITLVNATASTKRIEKVQNTSDTSGSDAIFFAEVGGVSAGDPIVKVAVNGGQTSVFAIDNSDTDATVISLSAVPGTNNAMRIATTGEINFPLQSAFLAYLSATANNVTGNSATYTLIADTEIYDQNSDYNNATGMYISPISAKVSFVVGMTYSELSASSTSGNITLVTSNRTAQAFSGNFGAVRDSANNFVISQAFPAMDMDSGDTASVTTVINGMAGNTVDVVGTATLITFFGGHIAF